MVKYYSDPQQIDTAIKSAEESNFFYPYRDLVCPVCGFEYNQAQAPKKIEGNDSYQAWSGRGDLWVIPFKGECGSLWEFCFGFHKGQNATFVRIITSCNGSNFLYFIRAKNTNMVKIGRSINPEKRLKQLSTGSPFELELVGKIDGGSELESNLHKKFSISRDNIPDAVPPGSIRKLSP